MLVSPKTRSTELSFDSDAPNPAANLGLTCPLCHTVISSAGAGAFWQCGRCGQQWTGGSKAAVVAYERWVETRKESR